MANLFGRSYSRQEILTMVGHVSQLCGVRRSVLTEGRARGVESANIWTGSGLEFSVNLSRGMGLGNFRYNGMPLGWISATGDVAPAFYESSEGGLDRSYAGGLLHMAGLRQVGAPCEDNGEKLGLHGRICNIPAENVQAEGSWDGDEYRIVVRGIIRETSALGENLVMTRRVSTTMGSRTVEIEDRVCNEAHTITPFMILYHTNFGFPLITEGSHLVIPSSEILNAFTGDPVEPEIYGTYQAPSEDAEQCIYFHKTLEREGWSGYMLVNTDLEIGLRVDYLKKNLPRLIHWRDLRLGHNVVEVGPSNCGCFGRAAEREADTLRFLEPGEVQDFRIRFTVLHGTDELQAGQTYFSNWGHI